MVNVVKHPFVVESCAEGGYVLSFPDLPGCMTQGETIAEVCGYAEEIYTLWCETKADGEYGADAIPAAYSSDAMYAILDPGPLYEHDCPRCTYLGHYRYAAGSVESIAPMVFDLYYCPQGGRPTVIARWSSEGSDYQSGMDGARARVRMGHDDGFCLDEAYRRAVEKGLTA